MSLATGNSAIGNRETTGAGVCEASAAHFATFPAASTSATPRKVETASRPHATATFNYKATRRHVGQPDRARVKRSSSTQQHLLLAYSRDRRWRKSTSVVAKPPTG